MKKKPSAKLNDKENFLYFSSIFEDDAKFFSSLLTPNIS